MCAYIFQKFEIGGWRGGSEAFAPSCDRADASPAGDFEFSKNVRTHSPSPRPTLQFRVLHIFDQTSHGPVKWDPMSTGGAKRLQARICKIVSPVRSHQSSVRKH